MKDLFELKTEFLEYCELDKGQSQLTISNYDRYLGRFFEWLKGHKNREVLSSPSTGKDGEANTENFIKAKPSNIQHPISSLSVEDITQESIRKYRLYVNRLKDQNGREIKQNTQNYHVLAIRAFLRFLSFKGIKCLSPEKVSVAKTGDREITFLGSEELLSILEAPNTETLPGLRDRAILETLFSTGLRVSELTSLNLEDINFERGEIAILGKGKKIRVVFLSQGALYWIDQYLKNRGQILSEKQKGEPLFISNKETRLSVRTIERIVKKYSNVAGLSKKVSPHTLRHSFATDLLMSGADIRSVQSLLGHSSITTTQIYTHVTDQHLREIHEKFHGKTMKNEQGDE